MTGHNLAMALRVAYLTLHRQTDALTAAEGVTADQFVVMAALAEENALSQRELADRTAADRNTLRAMVVLLEQQRFVQRTPHPRDRRVWCVSLTPGGRRVFRKIWRRTETLREELLARMSSEDVTAFVSLLRQFTAAI